MKETGIVRHIDDLGRLCLPKELHRTLGFEKNQEIEIFVSGSDIVLRKYANGCTICGNVDRQLSSLYHGKLICSGCMKIIVQDQANLQGGSYD